MDITQGTMTIAGNMSSQINSDIAAGYITAYGSDGTVNVDLVDGNTVITASPPDPNLASNPDPPDRGIVFGTEATLCWSPGINAVWHDVYLGTDFNDVNDDADPNVLPGRGRQDSNSFYVSGLTPGQTYYWRIDEVNSLPPYKGKIWNFTVVETYTNSLGM
ncbi:MAG: fibronectin type III domain-containing protein, partial [Planctomycetota bacterium]